MSIFAALRNADNALSAAGVAIRTAGHNIANAADEDYSRQRVEMASIPPARGASQPVGRGVEVRRIERVIDSRIEDALRRALGKFESLDTQRLAFDRLEGIFDELEGGGLEEALARFFDDARNLENLPQDPTARSLFARSAERLAEVFRDRDRELRELREGINEQIGTIVGEINNLTTSIAELNAQIVLTESGNGDLGKANDLRDQRDARIRELSRYLEVSTNETDRGTMSVFTGSDVLVEGGTGFAIGMDTTNDGDVLISQPELGPDRKLLTPRSGTLGGLIVARDEVVERFRDDLSTLARSLILEVNRVHTGGVGLKGYTEVTGAVGVNAVDDPLNTAGLEFTPHTGSFDLRIANELTGQVKTYNIRVDLDELGGDDTTLNGLRDAINTAVQTDFPAVAASISTGLELRVASSDENLTFTFANDTSDILAGLGIGTLFGGSTAGDIAISQELLDDPALIATGRGGGPKDVSAIQDLVALRDGKVLLGGEATFEEFYRGMVGVLGVEAAQVRDLLEHQETVTEHLRNERAAFSGVNIDEEAIDLIKYQRMYQGAARYLSVLDRLLDELMRIV